MGASMAVNEKWYKGVIHVHGARDPRRRAALTAFLAAAVMYGTANAAGSGCGSELLTSWNADGALKIVRVRNGHVAESILNGLSYEYGRRVERAVDGAVEETVDKTLTPFHKRYDKEYRNAKRVINPSDLTGYLGNDAPKDRREDRRLLALSRHLYLVALHQGDKRYFREAQQHMEMMTGNPSMALTHLQIADRRNEVRWPKVNSTTEVVLWVYRNLKRMSRAGLLEHTPGFRRSLSAIESSLDNPRDAASWVKVANLIHSGELSATLDHLAWMAEKQQLPFASDIENLAVIGNDLCWGGGCDNRQESQEKETPSELDNCLVGMPQMVIM